MRDWYDILPARVAVSQDQYDRFGSRWRFVQEQRAAGKTFREIGELIGVSTNRARQIWLAANRHEGPTPIERYFAETADLEYMALVIWRSLRKSKK